jgi:hypothetical protein
MTTRIKLRRDTAANWTSSNPILAAGEPGLESDTGKIKYGDGATAWTALDYTGGNGVVDSGDVVVTAGSTEHWVATQRRNNNDTRPFGQRYDSQGNLYVLTQSSYDDGNNTFDMAIITKYTAAGAVAWQKSFTETAPTSLAVDSSDCAYITLSTGDPVITVMKFNAAGTIILWKKDYDIGNIPAESAFIEEKSSTTLALAFSISDGAPGANAVVVMEINASTGAVEIKRQIALPGLADAVMVMGIDVDPDENVFVTGFYYDDGDEKSKMFVEKLDENLERVWTKSLETADTYDMYGGDCASDALGNIYVVGSYQVDTMNSSLEFAGNQSAGILAKLNSLGVVQWTRRLGPGPCGSFATGLTVTATGNVYLSAITFEKGTAAYLEGAPEFVLEGFGSSKMIVVRYDTQGDVIWQRYVDIANLYEKWNDEQLVGQAVAVFGDKFAVAGYGDSFDNVPVEDLDSDDDEYDCFVVQLPTDGTALTIGNLNFTESRVPARFITHTTTTSPLDNTAWTTSVTLSESTLVADTETRIANSLVKSETYDYTFGANGTLTIPNDGDLQLTQSQVGYLMAIGGSDNNDDNIYSRATTIDSQGNMYVVGNEEDNYRSFVTKISPEGVRQWGVQLIDDVEGNDNRANGITIHPTTGNLMVVCEVSDTNTYSILVTLDQDTGRILDTKTFIDSNSDVYLNDIAYTSTGTYVLAGSKNSEFAEDVPVTKQTGSTTGTILILRSAIPGPANNWQITGTNISVYENVAYVERYTGVTGTVRQGSGAVFDIIDNGNGTYSAGGGGGINYLVGHKIIISGAVLGGTTSTNDIIITVDAITGNGIIDGVSNVGTAAGTGTVTYSSLTGTNYLVGSGLEFTFQGPRETTNYNDRYGYSITAGGTNYVEGDVVVIPGTSLGGATTANDLTVTISVSGNAVNSFNTISGTSQSTTWKLETTTQVDFASTGSWLITYPLSRENLLITPTWQRTFGTNGESTDRLYAVAVDTGNNIIAVGEGSGELAAGDFYSLAMVYKFNSTGTLQWARQLNELNYHCYAKSVTTIGTDIYVTHESNDDGETVVTKLDSTGTVKWQRITDSGDDSTIARTADGNLLVAVEAYNADIDYPALKVFLLTPSGETVYQRWLMATTDGDTQFKNGRCLAVDGNSYYISAYFGANSYDSSIAARLPIDGSGTGEYGSFRYVGVNATTNNNFGGDSLTGINYNINELDLESGNNYAGELALVTAPYVNNTNTVTISTATGDFFVDSYYPVLTNETVRDTDGGSIIFPDGTKQNTSATDIPQRRYTGQRYTLGLKDRGHHILCTNTDDNIRIPYWSRVEFPVGTVITFVNTSGGNVYINQEGTSINLILAGGGGVYGVTLADNGIATLLMISFDQWIISGNVTETTP